MQFQILQIKIFAQTIKHNHRTEFDLNSLKMVCRVFGSAKGEKQSIFLLDLIIVLPLRQSENLIYNNFGFVSVVGVILRVQKLWLTKFLEDKDSILVVALADMFESYKKLKMIDFCSLVTVTRDGAIENNASYMHNNSCVIVNENRDKSMKRKRKIKKKLFVLFIIIAFFWWLDK